MPGIIGSSLGDAIAKAGAAIGNSFSAPAELQFKYKIEEEKEARELAKAKALKQFDDELAETKELRDAQSMTRIRARAQEIGARRAAEQEDRDVASLVATQGKVTGDKSPTASPDELRALLRDPANRETYRKAGIIGRESSRDPRLQQQDDLLEAAGTVGASSRVLKSLEEARKATLAEIKEENNQTVANQRHEQLLAQNERLGEQFRALLPIKQQEADAKTTAAKNPRSAADPNKPATTADLQRQITAAQNQIASELGVERSKVNEEMASLRRKAEKGDARAKATIERVAPIVGELRAAEQRMLDFKRVPSSSSSATPTAAPASTPAAPASKPGNNKKPGTPRDYSNLWTQ